MLEFDKETRDQRLTLRVFDERDGTTSTVQFVSFPVRIGRNPLNDLVLDDGYVSQWHAAVGFVNGQLTAVQVGTSNPVFVDERRLCPNEATALTGREVIQIVPFRVTLQLERRTGPPLAELKSVRVRRRAEKTTEVEHLRAEGGRIDPRAPEVTPSAPLPALSSPVSTVPLSPPVPSGPLTPPVPSVPLTGLGGGADGPAFGVLRQLARRFVGVELAADPAAVQAFGVRLEETLATLGGQVAELFDAGRQVRSHLGPRTREQTAADPARGGWLAALLGGDHVAAEAAFRGACRELLVQQLALLETLRAGSRAVLERLAPKRIAAKAAQNHRLVTAKVLWQSFEKLHKDLADEGGDPIFISQFKTLYAKLAGTRLDPTGAGGRPGVDPEQRGQ